MRCSNCGKNVAEVVAVARPRTRGSCRIRTEGVTPNATVVDFSALPRTTAASCAQGHRRTARGSNVLEKAGTVATGDRWSGELVAKEARATLADPPNGRVRVRIRYACMSACAGVVLFGSMVSRAQISPPSTLNRTV